MIRIALVNQKGGVGKSTTAVNLSAGLARLGQRVLLIDLDPQAHATVALGLDPRSLDKTVYSLLSGTAFPSEVIRPVSDRLSIIPANIHLAGGEAELASMPNPSTVLRNAMAGLDESQYDYAIIDSPPQLGFLNVNSLAWVREVFIPVTCEFYALHGLSLLVDTVSRVREKLNPFLRISGVITCQVHARRAITRDVLAELERHFPGRVLKTRIRVNVRLVEAPGHGKPIFDYAPDSNGAADYLGLAQELLALAPALVETVEAAPVAEVLVSDVPREPAPVAEAPAPEVPAEPAEAVVPEPAPALVAEREEPFVSLPPGAPLTTPVGAEAPVVSAVAGSSSAYAQMLGLAGLKPIVVGKAEAPAPSEKGKAAFGRRLLGRLIGRKE